MRMQQWKGSALCHATEDLYGFGKILLENTSFSEKQTGDSSGI